LTTLAANGVTVRFGHGQNRLTAVDAVDLTVPDGATVGLVGESGSGKSTLVRALSGLTPLAEGDVLLDGVPVRKRHGGRAIDGRRRVQMVFQDPFASLNPRMTVGEAVGEAVSVRGGAGRGTRRAQVQRLLELVHLDPQISSQRPSRLSGGQRQRVAIARALAARPEVLIADEITSSLDVSVQSAVLNLMRELRHEFGLSMIYVSHNLATVRFVSEMLAVMYLGRIVEVGPTDSVVADPRHPYTRALLAAVPTLRESTPILDPDLGEPPDPHQPPPGCHFHPRCPIGPTVFQDRQICIEQDPRDGAEGRPHNAFCHFAGVAAARSSTGESERAVPKPASRA
jgi:peptide/nickel transport system ATP-binding protein